MHIFLTNDDGIQAKGIHLLMEVASKRGHQVTVCAPKHQQSAASQKITLDNPIFVESYPTTLENVTAFSIDGTPTDCVRVGLNELVESPVDIIVSGINYGLNLGMAVHYSGTFGAAREGSLNNIHAIASSAHAKTDDATLLKFANHVIDVAQRYFETPQHEQCVININCPKHSDCFEREVVYAKLSERPYTGEYIKSNSPRRGAHYWLDKDNGMYEVPANSDEDYVRRGYITYTLIGNPVSYEQEKLDELKLWK